ncbi:hypothetical protein JCM9157_4672 [Halalkalibacter akibai JCM 9157]|uniref:Uncharacterized protein n=2 Tax=Halalkalibacter akibai TaxID=1411 RepID=W4QZ24_HALA3|nr:hypothetical protein JCM9157_4672 [Halalkalibacter akibai JCM 9157]
MNKEQTGTTVSQYEIEKMIYEALLKTNQATPLSSPQQQEPPKKDKLTNEDLDLLNNLF